MIIVAESAKSLKGYLGTFLLIVDGTQKTQSGTVLRDMGLGTMPGGILRPLLKFNMGVETGQLFLACQTGRSLAIKIRDEDGQWFTTDDVMQARGRSLYRKKRWKTPSPAAWG